PADVDDRRPAEVVKDLLDRLLRGRVVPADEHVWGSVRELGSEEVRVAGGVERLHDPGPGDRLLVLLARRRRVAERERRRTLTGERERVRRVNHDLSVEVN